MRFDRKKFLAEESVRMGAARPLTWGEYQKVLPFFEAGDRMSVPRFLASEKAGKYRNIGEKSLPILREAFLVTPTFEVGTTEERIATLEARVAQLRASLPRRG